MTRWMALVNPDAGARPVDPERVRFALAEAGVDGEVMVVHGIEEMQQALVEVVRSGRHPAVAGGDGTVGRMAGALVDAGIEKAPLMGVLPAGSGCDLLRTFGIPHDLVAAARHLNGEASYLMDLGVAEGEFGRRVFANVAQAGVGAAAAETAVRAPRSVGPARYPAAFALRLPRFPYADVEVITERRRHQGRALAVILANGQFFAGGWNVAPKATVVDGLLDVQILDVDKRQAPFLVPRLIKGLHLGHPGVKRMRASRVRLETSVPWPVEADGDHLGNTPVEVSVLPAALRLKI